MHKSGTGDHTTELFSSSTHQPTPHFSARNFDHRSRDASAAHRPTDPRSAALDVPSRAPKRHQQARTGRSGQCAQSGDNGHTGHVDKTREKRRKEEGGKAHLVTGWRRTRRGSQATADLIAGLREKATRRRAAEPSLAAAALVAGCRAPAERRGADTEHWVHSRRRTHKGEGGGEKFRQSRRFGATVGAGEGPWRNGRAGEKKKGSRQSSCEKMRTKTWAAQQTRTGTKAKACVRTRSAKRASRSEPGHRVPGDRAAAR